MDATVDVEPYLSAGITPAVLEIKDENKIVFLLKEVKSFFTNPSFFKRGLIVSATS
ncbi:hypothetical protein LWM68_22915 [Niabella sp. W65]|nr:hypothetical protein [Niabella sp. W65]MCH7365366.1 hypothetical protein [Niabella sp. W65]ULT41158.1 hypothetical protein KRR40_41800 [Niabella sp. I65]